MPFDKQALTAAPHHDPDAAISAGDEDELYRHYGVAGDRCPTAVDAPAAGERRDLTGTAGVQGRDTSGPTTDTAMTRSEEKLRVLTALTDLSFTPNRAWGTWSLVCSKGRH